mgnify:CR=1 FL=1
MKRFSCACAQRHHVLYPNEQLARPLYHLIPDRSENDFAIVALNETHPERFLKFEDARAERTLAHMRGDSGLPKMLVIGDGAQVAQLFYCGLSHVRALKIGNYSVSTVATPY